jgi:hypothetical protein
MKKKDINIFLAVVKHCVVIIMLHACGMLSLVENTFFYRACIPNGIDVEPFGVLKNHPVRDTSSVEKDDATCFVACR